MKLSNQFATRLIPAFVAGVTCAQQFHSLPNPWALAAFLIIAASFWQAQQRMLACFLLGMSYALICASFRLHQAPAQDMFEQELMLEGKLQSLPKHKENGASFEFKADQIRSPLKLNGRQNAQKLKAGQRWRFKVKLKPAHGFMNPGSMDYEGWLFAQNIQAVGYVLDDPQNRKIEDSGFSAKSLRQFLYDKLSQALKNSEFSGIIKALTLGCEEDIGPKQWDVFKRTGTLHLIAISGSHISLIAGIFYFVTLKLAAFGGCLRLSPPRLAAIMALSAAWLYSALADFAIPTQRALIMIAIVMGGLLTQRAIKPLHMLSLALLFVTLYDPWSVLAPGFWLSFMAVALILFSITPRIRPVGALQDLWHINWLTSLGLAPLLLLFFQQVSLISPLANLIAVPGIGMIATPLCLLGSALLLIHEASGLAVLHFTESFLHPIWQILETLSALPFAQWLQPSPPIWALAFSLIGALWLLTPRGIPGRCVGFILLLPALTIAPKPPDSGHFKLTMLDVGQGLSIVVQTHSHLLVYDTGAQLSPKFNLGSAVIEPFIRKLGIQTIDALILSSAERDHIGGADALIESFKIQTIITNIPKRFAQAKPCQAGNRWTWDEIEFEIFQASGLEKTCTLKVTTGQHSALITGDMSPLEEKALIERYGAQLAGEIIVAPHHGSKQSSQSAFIERVKPSYALFSCGYKNRHRFPNPEVLKRYHENGAKTFNSAQTGAVSVKVGQESGIAPPESHRQTHGRYWSAFP